MSEKKYIFSWGGGVNSTAILAMIKLGMLPHLTKDNTHIVFADTGAEMPYTYEHTSNCLHPMAKEGWICKSLSPHKYPELYSNRCKNKGLPEYCLEKGMLPSRINRWCTMEWKSSPIRKYRESLCSNPSRFKKETIMILGIGADEKHRAKELGFEWTSYPLIDHNIDREKCFKLSEQAGLPVPRKSGCYFCPYQAKQQWLDLYKDLPYYFNKAEELETNSRIHYDGKGYYLRGDIPIREQIKKWLSRKKEECKQGDLFLERHCLCEL